MRWLLLVFLFYLVPLSADSAGKPSQKMCQCRCQDNWQLERCWKSLSLCQWKSTLSANPSDERERQRHQILDIEISGRLTVNYDRYQMWKGAVLLDLFQKSDPDVGVEEIYYNYSNFLVKREYARKSADIVLDWDLAEVDINRKFYPNRNVQEEQAEAYRNYYARRQKIADAMTEARQLLKQVYQECREKHRCLKTAYEYGLLSQHLGDYALSAHLMSDYAELASTLDEASPITPEAYLLTSESLLSALDYDQAIQKLTEAIQKYPERKELYEKRITAYLELGRYQEAAQDYLSQDFEKELAPDATKVEVTSAFLKGAAKGGIEGVRDYPTSLLYSNWPQFRGDRVTLFPKLSTSHRY